MKTILAFPLLLAGLFTISPFAGAQSTIFSDLSPNGGWTVYGQQLGEEVTVAGANWQVTSLQIEIYSQGTFPNGGGVGPGFANFQASLYANNGSQGAPGTLLWQSAFVPDNYPAGLSVLTYAVPNVVVPSQFTWTLRYTNFSNQLAPPALPTANAPTIGTYNSSWFGVPGSWTKDGSEMYMAQITAVPEPGPVTLFLGGTVTLWILAIRREAQQKIWFFKRAEFDRTTGERDNIETPLSFPS
jgi:hypothetical protein